MRMAMSTSDRMDLSRGLYSSTLMKGSRVIARARRRRVYFREHQQDYSAVPTRYTSLTLGSLTIKDAERHDCKDSFNRIQVEDFVKNPDDKFICPVCYEILTEPQLLECCGHHICSSCMTKWQRFSKSILLLNCPYCTSISRRYILDQHFLREVNALEVHCTGTKHGCTWKGELGNLVEHQRDCLFVYEVYQLCVKPVLRHQMATHKSSEREQRSVRCDDCGNFYIYNMRDFHNERVCAARVLCPNLCGEKINKCAIQCHRAICPNELVQCPYSDFGCFAYPPRKALQEHVSSCSQQYTLKLLRKLKCSQEERDAMKQELTVLKTTMIAALSSIRGSIDTMSQHITDRHQSKALKSIRVQFATLSRPHLHMINKVISLSIRKAHGQNSKAFCIFDGYMMRLHINMHEQYHDKLQLSLILIESDHDNILKWLLEKHAQLYLSIGEHQVPFSPSQKGVLTKKVDRVQRSGGHICAWRDTFTTSGLRDTIYMKLYCEKPTILQLILEDLCNSILRLLAMDLTLAVLLEVMIKYTYFLVVMAEKGMRNYMSDFCHILAYTR